jgi:hypothetical protein
VTTCPRSEGGTCSITSDTTTVSKQRSRKGNWCPEHRTGRMFFTGGDGKVRSHPTKGPLQYSPNPREPEPTSNRPSSLGLGGRDLNSRRIGKKREARLSKSAYPPRVPGRRNKTFDFAPVVIVKKMAQQNCDSIGTPKDYSRDDKSEP